MRARPPVLTLLATAVATFAALALSTSANAAAPSAVTPAIVAPAIPVTAGPAVTHSCATPSTPHTMHCFALRRTDVPGVSANGMSPNATPSGYGPSDLQDAYNLSASGGSGKTVAIVDAYNDPNAASDLAVYRSQYGLPACTVSSGCLRILNQNGATSPLPSNDSGWAGEISLDLDMVSAICPNCHIILIEADSATDSALYTAENTAASLADYVSNSWGGGESSGQTSDDANFNHPGVAITVSSGDNGNGAEYPATSRYVTAVGGTSLNTSSNSRGWTESAWNGAGSGCSSYDSKPSWQTVSTGCSRRAEADVSAVADPNTGLAVYVTYGGSGWNVYGGTSASAPIIASVYALAGTPGSSDYPASYPYSHTGNLYDVTSGSNGSCGAPMCSAGSGWDGPTGLGTPNGTAAFTAGGGGPGPVSLNNPGSQTSTVGTADSVTLSASGGTAPYTFSATGLPAGMSLNTSTGVISGTPTTAQTKTVNATVHDSASGTDSVSFSWTVSGGGGGGCSGNALSNPGFESGNTVWSSSSGVIGQYGASEPTHSGSWDAWFDGYGSSHTDTLSQSVSVPSGCSATLKFYLHIDTAETTTSRAYDTFKVQMIKGGVTTTLATYSNLNDASGYQLHSLTLSGAAGSTVTVKFTGTEDYSLYTSFVVDDTSVTLS